MVNKRWQISTLLLVGLCFLLPLVVYAYLGTFNRWIADDYCEAAYVKTGGVLIGSIMLYISWTGRFFASVIGTFLTTLGPGAAPFVPAVVVLLWLVVLAAALYQASGSLGWSPRLFSAIFLAVVILSSAVQLSPKVDQPLFWEQAMADTIPALVLGTLFVYLVIYHRRKNEPAQRRRWEILFFCIAFVAGGCCETYAAAQTSAYLLMILGVILFASAGETSRSLPWMLAGFLGSIFALVLNLLAPGNIGHQHLYAPVPGAPGLIKITLESLFTMLSRSLTHPLRLGAVLSLAGIAVLAGAGLLFDLHPLALSKRGLRIALAVLPFITLIEVTACLVPAAYGQSTPPPDRTLIVPYYLLACALAIEGYLAGQYLRQADRVRVFQRRKILAGCLTVVFALSSLFSTAQVMQLRPAISQFAAAWDRSHSLILQAKAQGLDQVTVPPFPNWAGIEDISPDPTFWVNRCAKIYYGIEVRTQ